MLPKEIQSLQHPIVKTFVKLRTNRKFRAEKKQIVLAGTKMVGEAKSIDILLIKKGEDYSIKAKETFLVTEEILKKVTGEANPEPLSAIAPMPDWDPLVGKSKLVALDRIKDPGNMGTLLRTALALGWEGVFLTTSCVDPFNEKALRASMGAALRIPMMMGSPSELIALAKDQGLTPLIADMEGEPFTAMTPPKRPLLILGNESTGVSPALKDHFKKISIPITGIESLNVAAAGAILMYTLGL